MSFNMDVEPLKLKHEYPPVPDRPGRDIPSHYRTRKSPNNAGPRPAHDEDSRRRIALRRGSTAAVAAALSVAKVTVYRYRREFRQERIAAGLEKETAGAAAVQRVRSERAARNAPRGNPPAGAETSRGQEIQDHLL